MKRVVILFYLFLYSYTGFSQNRNFNEDSVLHSSIFTDGDYPKSLIKSNESVIAFCQVTFKKGNKIDTVIIFNTENDEVIEFINNSVRRTIFKKFSKQKLSLLIPFIFKNIDEFKNHNINFNFSEELFAQIFKLYTKNRTYSYKLIQPVYKIYSAPRKIE